MSGDLVLHGASDPFAFAERIANSNLVPTAYRGKPTDLAIAVMYGNELGLPPMTSLQRVVVINGKPTLDAQGFVSLIRQAGHSISGEVDADKATVVGKRGDTGDTMQVTFTMEDARRAELLKNATYRKFPSDMLWARAVTQLARRLFPDVMLAVSYAPEEMQAVVESNGNGRQGAAVPEKDTAPPEPSRTLRPPPGTPKTDAETGEIIDAEVVEDEPKGPPAKKSQKDNLHRLFGLKGITERDARLAYCIHVISREIASSNELTEAEANKLIAQLKEEVGEEPPLRDAS